MAAVARAGAVATASCTIAAACAAAWAAVGGAGGEPPVLVILKMVPLLLADMLTPDWAAWVA